MAGGEKNAFLKTWDRTVKVHKKNLRMFWYWVYERQNIYHKRFILKFPPPWTKDPILRNYKFTNVYRELDKNSIWLINNVCKRPMDPVDKMFKIMVCRLFNNPSTFEELGIPKIKTFKKNKFLKGIDAISKRGDNPFTNAYLVHSGGIKGIRRNDFYAGLIDKIHKEINVIYMKVTTAKTPEKIHSFLSSYPSIGDFVAYELYCDFIYAKLIKFTENDFVNVGPGAHLGLILMFPSKTNNSHVKLIKRLRDKQEYYFKKYGFSDFKYLDGNKRLTLRGVEHSLCEVGKLAKMRMKVGKQRSKFTPTTNIKYIKRIPK